MSSWNLKSVLPRADSLFAVDDGNDGPLSLTALSSQLLASGPVSEGLSAAANALARKVDVAAVAVGNIALTGTPTIDGVAVSAGDRVLVTGQTAATENGIYTVASPWVRASDADADAEIANAIVTAAGGTAYGGTTWRVNGAPAVGTDDIEIVEMQGLNSSQTVAAVALAEAARDAAAASATSASTDAAQTATDRLAAAAASTASTTARDTAQAAAMVAGAVFADDTTAGLAATSVDDFFFVPSGPGVHVYRHDSGPTATFVRWLSEVLYDDVAALLASTFSGFAVGTYIRTRAEGMAYKVAPVVAVDHHVTTAGAVRLYVQPGSGGFDVRAFGATADGTTDDAGAIQAAINAAASAGGVGVTVPSGVYRCASTVRVFRDAVENPGFPDGPLLAGRLQITGHGCMRRRDYQNDTVVGSVIKFDAGHRLELSAPGQRGWGLIVSDLSVLGDNPTLIHHPFAASFYRLSNLFVGNAGAVNGSATVYISDNYVGALANIEIIGDKTLPSAVGTQAGFGLHVDPSDTAGGANTYQNITAAYFAEAILIGRTYDPTRTAVNNTSRGNLAVNLQGQFSHVGIHLAQGCANLTLQACWTEHCDVAPLRIDNSARNIEIISASGAIAPGKVGAGGIICIGNNTGTAGQDAAYNIKVGNSDLFCSTGIGGVMVFDGARDVLLDGNSFRNGGGAAVALEGGIGGEVMLVGSNYHPDTEPSAVTAVRRVCRIDTPDSTPSFVDLSFMARMLDYRPALVAQDVDADGWRHPPNLVILGTSGASRTLTLPDLSAAGGRLASVIVVKPQAANTIVIDAQAGGSIKGAQTYTMTSAGASIELVHRGSGSGVWDVIREQTA